MNIKFEITQEVLDGMTETELAFLYMAICGNVEEDTSELLQYLIAERDGEKIYTQVEYEFWRLYHG